MSAKQQSDKHQDLILVGIGASAGGLAALRELLRHTPKDGAIAYVVVVHLSPDHESHLADLLQTHSEMPVIQVTEDMPIEPNRVYVIPPGRNLSTIDDHLRLSPLEDERRARAPIDYFFRTLADQHKERAIAVLLSGTGSDGAVGIGQVKEFGGLVIVQSPDEAEYPGMPQSAIATGLVDLILPLREIPGKILQYATSTPEVRVPDDDPTSLPKDDREILGKIIAQIRLHTNHDFVNYKPSTIMRRIIRRMQLSGAESLESYLQRLRRNQDEVGMLFNDLLITITSFFRDPEAFKVLEREVIPELFANKESNDTVRVWVAGCATGEEAYSLGMLLLEYASRLEYPPEVQLFASDVYPAALTRAREGLYPETIAATLSEERIERFFTPQGNFYQVRKELRERILFAPHNLLTDPPFSKLDLISCRNMLIYLKREAQRDVFRMFHYALREHGYLFLGSSESLVEAELFTEVNKQAHLYSRTSMRTGDLRLLNLPFTRTVSPIFDPHPNHEEARSNYGPLHARVIERYAPPSVLVNAKGEMTHLSMHAGRFMQQPGGEPTNELLRRVRDPLRTELRTALYQTRESQRPVVTPPLPLTIEGEPREVVLSVRPVLETGLEGYLLVIFDERDPQTELATGQGVGPAKNDQVVEQLEAQLEATKRQLQTVIEEFETSREEMKASNEELQSMNEELRSTAEELESSKEELQSINEELITVNQENRHKVEELSQVTSDLQNLLAATDIATIFLDREGRIMRFTPKASELFNILPTDRGRLLSDLSHRLGDARLSEDTRKVLRTLQPIERELTSDSGHIYLMRLLPYRSIEERIDGVVLTFIDIDHIRRSEEARQRSEERLKLVIESAVDYAIFTTDPEGRVDSWNQGAERVFGFTEKEIVGEPVSLIFTPEDREAGVPERELKTAAQNGRAPDKRWHLHKNGEYIWIDGVTTALRDTEGTLYGFAKIGRDDSERKWAETALQESEERFRLFVTTTSDSLYRMSADWGKMIFLEGKGFLPDTSDPKETWLDTYIPDSDKEAVQASITKAIRAKTTFELEHRVIRADGTVAWVYSRATPLLDEHGEIDEWFGVASDITERKAIEAERQRLLEELQIFNETLEERVAERTKALERSEQRFARAFHAGPVAACITSLGRETFIEVNTAFLKLTGYTRDEVIGRTSFELGMWSSREDREKLTEAQAAEQGFNNLELSLRDKSDNVHVVLMSAEIIDLSDNRCYLKMFYDVTDRKRTEVQLMAAIQDVMSDTTWFSHSLLERLAQLKTGHTESDEVIELTPRERQVLERVAQGKNNEQIADDLGLASQTVRNYITNIYSKIGVNSRSEAIVWARERGLVAL